MHVTSATQIPPQNKTLFELLGNASSEISAYRKRQITTFREIIIVQGLITWGVSKLSLKLDAEGIGIRMAAAIACLAAAWIGWWIMGSYRKRIHHIRDSRDQLVRRITTHIPQLGGDFLLFYPTDKEKVKEEYQTERTSVIYSWMLWTVGLLTTIVNVLGPILETFS